MKNNTVIQEEATTIESIKFSTSYSYYYSTLQKNIVSKKTPDMRIYDLSIGGPGLTQRGWTNKWGVRDYESTTVVSLKIKVVDETTIILFLSEKGNETGKIYHYEIILNPYHYEIKPVSMGAAIACSIALIVIPILVIASLIGNIIISLI